MSCRSCIPASLLAVVGQRNSIDVLLFSSTTRRITEKIRHVVIVDLDERNVELEIFERL
jgi:hypothetical protein